MKITRASLALAVALALAAGISFHGFWDKHWESRRAEASREIVASGNWLVPTLVGEPFVTKPPLSYWTMAALFKATGTVSDRLSRLPSAVLTLASVFLVISMARRWRRPDGTLHCDPLEAGIIYATLPMVFAMGITTETEAYLLFFTCLTLWGYLGIEPGAEERRNLKWRAAFALGLVGGFMIKGPLGWIFPMLGVLAHEFSQERGARRLKWVDLPIVLAAHALLAAPWFVEVYRTVPIATKVWTNETVRRVGDETFMTHREPFWYYLPSALLNLPWLVLLPGALRRTPGEKAGKNLWPLIWFALGIIVLSVATSKRHHYALSFAPGLALALAAGRKRLAEAGEGEWAGKALRIMGFALPVLSVGAVAWLALNGNLPYDYRAAMAFAAAGAGLWLMSRKPVDAVSQCGIGLIASFIVASAGVMPAVDAYRCPDRFFAEVARAVPEGEVIANWNEDRYSSSFYLNRIVRIVRTEKELNALMPDGGWLVGEEESFGKKPPARAHEKFRMEAADPFNPKAKQRWVLYRVEPPSRSSASEIRRV